MFTTDEEFLDRREIARHRADARAEARMDRRYSDADALIGELNSAPRFYINVRSKAGHLTGAIRRFQFRHEASSFLIRNRYG